MPTPWPWRRHHHRLRRCTSGAEAAERARRWPVHQRSHRTESTRTDGDSQPFASEPRRTRRHGSRHGPGSGIQADLIFANDPDVIVSSGCPEWKRWLSDAHRNEIGCSWHRLINAHCKNAVVGTTIVSSRLLSQIAAAHDVDYFETLTGFKWIANRAITETIAGKQFLMGYEEALGYTVGNLVRDKDGISALVAFALHAARLHDEGESILGLLENIYRKYGLYVMNRRVRA